MNKVHFLLFISTLAYFGCSRSVYVSKEHKNWETVASPDSSHLVHTVYLIGDAGDPNLSKIEPTFKLLKSQADRDSNSSIVFLGDNIYHEGLPAVGESGRENAEKKINEQINILNDFKGKGFFIAGNHDWEYMSPGGLAAVRRQEEYIETKMDKGNTFIPDNGCPGPFKVKLQGNIILLAIDSQWWLHDHTKPYGRGGDCEAEDENDFLTHLKDFIESNKNKHILVVAHHPLYSNGNHGGFYTALDHFFPLRLLKRSWISYIPLPGLGSIYPLHRKFGGVAQDIPHYRYQKYIESLLDVFKDYDNITYAAGHEHNLQYHKVENLNHIVSGSGSKLNPVKGGGQASFVRHHEGFAKAMYYDNGDAWVEFWTPEGDGDKGKLEFRTKLYSRKERGPELFCGLSKINYEDSSIITAPVRNYKISGVGRAILGSHYRKEWSTPIKVDLLDLKTEQGGLIPYGIGGGKQSISLKLRDLDDHEYKLRSISKDPEKAIPVDFRNTFIEDLVSDQISAQHPYGALVIPPLAKAANVYHTTPKLVVIPNDSCLGPYKEEFKDMLAMFEVDPDENQENVESFGYSKNIVGTDKVISELEDDNDNKIDQLLFVRTRLFDMLLGDWDRHSRQYRWGSFKKDKGTLYKVIPEDRDQVFFKFDGALPWLASRKWAVRNLQDFDSKFRDLKGLNFTAKDLDRRFATAPTGSQWVAIADSMKNSITDEVIEKAIKSWPEEIYKLHGEEIISHLKKRRDLLPEAASKYYQILSRYVDVRGSNKNERFLVERLNDDETRVTVYKISKEGEVKNKIYERVFQRKETQEIRLYGLDGSDEFEVRGEANQGTLVRIIGGEGKDKITDKSRVSGVSKKTVVYDTKEGNEVEGNNETNLELSKHESVNDESLDQFRYNYFGPQVTMFFNQDDGVFLGGGFVFKKYKFRGLPFNQEHRIVGSIATGTGSALFEYDGTIRNLISSINLVTKARIFAPSYVMNYFGYGNESQFLKGPDSIDYYRVRLNHIHINPSFNKNLTRYFTIGLGPKYESYAVQQTKGKSVLSDSLETSNSNLYGLNQYVGLRSFFRLGAVDNQINPSRGMILTAEANFNRKIKNFKSSYSQYLSEFIFYISPNITRQLTFAGRIGGAMNFGDFEFYQANMLGGGNMLGIIQNLRGYRKTRFIGDKSFYQNAEVRLELLKFNFYLFPGKFGIIGLFDNGRVWAKGENSTKWHTGYGGGLWLNIFNKLILSGTYTISEEDALTNIRLGFFF